MPEASGDVVDARPPEHGDDRIPERRHRLRPGAFPHAALILMEAHVPHTEESILDTPMPTPQLKQRFGARSLARKTRHEKLDLFGSLAVYLAVSSDLGELFRAGPVGVVGDDGCQLDAPAFASAVRLFDGLERFDLTPPDDLFVGGKKVRRTRRRCRP